MVVRAFVRLVISIISAVIPLFFLSGSYSPIIGSSMIGNYLPNLLGQNSSLNSILASYTGGELPIGVLPLGAAGLTGFVVYGILQRVLSTISMATYSSPKMDPSKIMESMQANMPWMNMAGATMVSTAQKLPSDITKSQYLVLSKYRQGMNKSKDIARALSTDKHHVEAETRMLKMNGYLTNKSKLTSKALETLA